MQAQVQYPKLLTLPFIFITIYISGSSGETIYLSDSFLHSLQVGMSCIIDCFSGTGVNIGVFILEVAYGCSLCTET